MFKIWLHKIYPEAKMENCTNKKSKQKHGRDKKKGVDLKGREGFFLVAHKRYHSADIKPNENTECRANPGRVIEGIKKTKREQSEDSACRAATGTGKAECVQKNAVKKGVTVVFGKQKQK